MLANKQFFPNLKHKGETQTEQLEKNRPAMELLKKWLQEEVIEEESCEREEYWDTVKELIDWERPTGFKLYTEE